MIQNSDVIDDAFWNELRSLIKAYLQGRVHGVHDDGNISLCHVPDKEVTFIYTAEELFVSDNSVETFVDNIILTLRDK